jgi:organic radical activating enzyme
MNKDIKYGNEIKKTRSLCSVCLREIDAWVYERAGKIFMKKKCQVHTMQDAEIETNVLVYNELYNPLWRQERQPFVNLAIPITNRCNLDCHICYASPGGDDMSKEKVCEYIRAFQGKMIWFTGGEPTLHSDLPMFIDFARKHQKIPVLITNGIKLSDITYVYQLKKAGLSWVHFAFNGFSDNVYKKINNAALLKNKNRALKNLKKLKIYTALSFLYVDSINNDQIKDVFLFCLKNHSFIRQLRIRSAQSIGKNLIVSQVFLSQLIEAIAYLFGIDTNDFFQKVLVEQKVIRSDYYASPMPCHIEISVKSIIKKIVKAKKWNVTGIIKGAYFIAKRFGIINLVWIGLEYYFVSHKSFELIIKLRSWPDKKRIDLGEMRHCVSAHIVNATGKLEPFCKAIILNEKHE